MKRFFVSNKLKPDPAIFDLEFFFVKAVFEALKI